MVSKEFVLPRGSGCTLIVDVVPGAVSSEIAGVNRWRGALPIRLAAPAKDDAANRELLRFLADQLAVQEDRVRIVVGRRSRHKVLHIDMPMERTARLLVRE
ncbi:MAG: DUF167 domain-containing protein [Thermoplasmata archaeon]